MSDEDFTIFGYPTRLTIELPDGPYDITGLLIDENAGWVLDARTLAYDIALEQRARRIAAERTT